MRMILDLSRVGNASGLHERLVSIRMHSTVVLADRKFRSFGTFSRSTIGSPPVITTASRYPQSRSSARAQPDLAPGMVVESVRQGTRKSQAFLEVEQSPG